VFACSDVVGHAIEQLDCRVVEGKILAVQRATEGKASFGRESSTGGNDIGVLRDGGMGAAPPLGGSGGSGGNLQHLHGGHAGLRDQQQHAHQQQHALLPHGPPLLPHRGMHHRSSSSTGSGLGLPPHMLPSDHSLTAASTLSGSSAGGSGLFGSGGSASSGGGSASGGHTRSHSGGGHGLPGMAAFAAAAGGGSAGPLPPPAAAAAAAAAGDGSTLGGPRVPTGPPPPGASVLLHSSGPSSTKQYDVNELYIGDLPLTWDEDAVRRLLGRFGRIKYFTLRNGRDK
jgi:hypothetical protein